jgi:hypothetical protein
VSDVAGELDQLRIALGETEALAAVTVESYDRQDWDDALHVERLSYMPGLIWKSVTAAMEAFHRLHGAIADAQPVPAPAGVQWDYSEGTAPGPGEQGPMMSPDHGAADEPGRDAAGRAARRRRRDRRARGPRRGLPRPRILERR